MVKRTRLAKHAAKVQHSKDKRRKLFQAKCDGFCNRLQAGGNFLETAKELALAVNIYLPKEMPEWHLSTELMSRVTTRLETLQINYPDNVSFRCHMEFRDYTKPPVQGYLFPSKVSSFTSPSMSLSVIICYIRLCSYVGRFL